MKIYNLRIVLLLSSLLSLSHCLVGQYTYINDPETTNITLSEKNNLELLFLIPYSNYNVQLGYSPIKHVAIKAGFYEHRINKFRGFTQKPSLKTSGSIFSFTLGTYYFFPKRKIDYAKQQNEFKSQKGILVFFNTSYSKGFIKNRSENVFSKFNYQKYSIDTGVEIISSHCSFNFNFKYSRFFFAEGLIRGDFTGFESYYFTLIDELENNSFFSTLEFNIQAEVGVKQGRFIIGLPIEFQGIGNIGRISRSEPRGAYLGLVFEIDKLVK